jgi:hypothetical protein
MNRVNSNNLLNPWFGSWYQDNPMKRKKIMKFNFQSIKGWNRKKNLLEKSGSKKLT